MEQAEDELTIELVNGSDDVLRASPKEYIFYRLVDGEWHYIRPRSQLADLVTIEIAPGDRRQWQINLDTTHLGSLYPMNESPRSHDWQDFTFRFPPGTYAFGFPVWFAQRDITRLYVRTFDVVGDDPTLVPSTEVVEAKIPVRLTPQDIRRQYARTSDGVDGLTPVPSAELSGTNDEGSTVVVRTQTSSEYDHERPVTLLAESIEETPSYAVELPLFELYNPRFFSEPVNEDEGWVDARLVRLLRDAFAHVDPSIDRVRVETTGTAKPPLGLAGGEAKTVTYGGRTWRLRSTEGWEESH